MAFLNCFWGSFFFMKSGAMLVGSPKIQLLFWKLRFWLQMCQNGFLSLLVHKAPLFFISKRRSENSDIFTLTCTQFPQSLMLHMYIAKRLVLYPNRLKTSKMQYNKSIIALFSALIHSESIEQFALTQLSGSGEPIRTALGSANHLAHTARRFKCTTRFFCLSEYWSNLGMPIPRQFSFLGDSGNQGMAICHSSGIGETRTYSPGFGFGDRGNFGE